MGAFEVTARYANLKIDDAAFPLYASAATSANEATSYGLGPNWYLSKAVAFKLETTSRPSSVSRWARRRSRPRQAPGAGREGLHHPFPSPFNPGIPTMKLKSFLSTALLPCCRGRLRQDHRAAQRVL